MEFIVCRSDFARWTIVDLFNLGKRKELIKLNKKEILFYGALLESDMYVDGYGSTDEDTELLQKALRKVYGVKNDTPEEELLKIEKQMDDDLKNLVIEYRDKVSKFLDE